MARSINTIFQEMITAKEADSNLNELTSNSQVAIWRLIFYIVAVSINLFEQFQDLFKAEIQTIADTAIPGTLPWARQKTTEFQYSATDPQNLILINLVPIYPVLDESLRIITRASVTEGTALDIRIKVAKNEPPEPLSIDEEIALNDYWNTLRFAGTSFLIVNNLPDRLYINAEIFYDGAYVSVIQANVIDALVLYLENLSSADNFNGLVRNSAIVDAIQNVEGVIDVKLNQTRGRAESTPFAGGTIINVKYESFAGYIIQEDTAGQDFANTLTFTQEV